MAGIGSKVSPILTQSAGNIRLEAERIRAAGADLDGKDVSNALNGIQSQLDSITKALARSGILQELIVTDTRGSLIGWVGDRIVNAVTYMGAWFKQLYIGGTGADDAKIVADASGNVTINGATITLSANGVLTTIENLNGPDGLTESLTSLDITIPHGQLTAVTPFAFKSWVWDPIGLAYVTTATLRTAGGGGRVTLSKVNTGNLVILATDGTGSPFVLVTDGVTPVTLSPSLGLQFAGVSAIDATRNGALVNLAISGNFTGTHAQNVGAGDSPTFAKVTSTDYSVGATPGVSVTDTRVSAVPSATGSFLTSISVSTSTIGYTAGATTATFVDGVGSSSSSALTSVTPTAVSDGYTKGLRTS